MTDIGVECSVFSYISFECNVTRVCSVDGTWNVPMYYCVREVVHKLEQQVRQCIANLIQLYSIGLETMCRYIETKKTLRYICLVELLNLQPYFHTACWIYILKDYEYAEVRNC